MNNNNTINEITIIYIYRNNGRDNLYINNNNFISNSNSNSE